MGEGNIIQFPANRIVRKESENFVRNKKEEDLQREEKGIAHEKFEEFLSKLTAVGETLNALEVSSPNAIRLSNVQKRKELVHEASMVELMDIIIAANKIEIKKHPSYYQAVIDEIETRL